ncbi:SCA7-domain-containing protein [Laetiporus sulphureus 93-53]|uniref:SCA7-domain-containing protein n=1 Tax=Laetiporus sulphureus 93-53 TaxID=1314785 RepID=A0A165GB59_9APHY|nr:SCA7-domain-containing protein [Laetiporus sulphureus 93-53]KZT10100.1 SCA7-domain-containing protein [Laetiporus sulphureus 93-53]
MTIKLKPSLSPSPPPLMLTDEMPASPADVLEVPGSPPTTWLSARDMKMYGLEPLRSEVGIIRCKDCGKPILKSAIAEHADNCAKIRSGGKKAGKGKANADAEDSTKKGKKRKADDEDLNPDDPKKKKPAPKVNKGRFKGPVDYDKQCGVINDKGLPCSRSLTCKSHSMGAKRAVQGRSKPYDELLLEWNRLNNPNWVEPVKRESKAEKKERKEREKAEKKRQQAEAAAAAGVDVTKKGANNALVGTLTKKNKKATAAAAAAAVVSSAGVVTGEDGYENLDEVDSEAELDSLVHAVRAAQDTGLIGVPLAVPCDASSWFVARRERLRSCNQLVASALMPSSRNSVGPGGPRLA